MKLVEAAGDARTIGRATGEALRDEIHAHLELYPPKTDTEGWKQRLPVVLETLNRFLPQVLEEMHGTAEGADVPVEQIYGLNVPMYNNELDMQGCTNIVFGSGPDGPICYPSRGSCCRRTAAAGLPAT